MSSEKQPPSHVDFVVFTIKKEEDAAIRAVLGLAETHIDTKSGVTYYWGLVEADANHKAVVVHVSTGEAKGPKELVGILVAEAVRIFDPANFLVLGIAGGFKQRKRTYGQVVYSRIVRSSSNRKHKENNEIDLEEDQNPPPDRVLLNLAQVPNLTSMTSFLEEIGIKPPEAIEVGEPELTEFFSGPDLIDDPNSAICQAVLRQFPRVGAVEMESEKVANTLSVTSPARKPCPYLVIKGMSDLIDDEDLKTAEEHKTKRDAWGPYAACASATFAREIIKMWASINPASRDSEIFSSTYEKPFERVIPLCLPNNKALVFHNLHPSVYSTLSQECTQLEHVQKIFTVCAYEPNYFVNEVKAYLEKGQGKHVGQITDNKFLSAANGVFRHFAAFRSFHEKKRNIIRIMLANDSLERWRRRNSESLELFALLNGQVDCYVAEVQRLLKENLRDMSDHVVFNSELWLHYNDKSQTLITTLETEGRLSNEFNAFEQHFTLMRVTNLYTPLSAFIKSSVRAVHPKESIQD